MYVYKDMNLPDTISTKTVLSNCLRNLFKCNVLNQCIWKVWFPASCAPGVILPTIARKGQNISHKRKKKLYCFTFFQSKSPDKAVQPSPPPHFSVRLDKSPVYFCWSGSLPCSFSCIRGSFYNNFLQNVLNLSMKRFCLLTRPVNSLWEARSRNVTSPCVGSCP